MLNRFVSTKQSAKLKITAASITTGARALSVSCEDSLAETADVLHTALIALRFPSRVRIPPGHSRISNESCADHFYFVGPASDCAP
jgi:hypothetical protein